MHLTARLKKQPTSSDFYIMYKNLDAAHKELFAIIRGEGKYRFFGNGIHIYPDSPDKNNIKLYKECEKLKEEGLIYIAEEETIGNVRHLFYRANT